MDCPKANCSGTGVAGDHMTDFEHASARNTIHNNTAGKHPLLGLGIMAFMGVKMVASKAYKCGRCGHVWRKWL
jgi:hypothetical protein